MKLLINWNRDNSALLGTRVLFSALMLFTFVSEGALAPEWEAKRELEAMEESARMRDVAPDYLHIRTLGVRHRVEQLTGCPAQEHWEINAVVERALRGKIKVGSQIIIHYSNTLYFCPGVSPFSPADLQPGQRYTALLACDPTAVNCELAAGAWSFVDDFAFRQKMKKVRAEVFE